MDSIMDGMYAYSDKHHHTALRPRIPHLPALQKFSVSAVDVAAVAAAATVFLALAHARRRARGERSAPVTEWPVLGMLPALLMHIDVVYDWFSDALVRAGGTFFFCGPWFSSVHALITCDPVNVEYMLKTRFGNFPKGGYFRSILGDLLGDGIFNADDELWRRQRKAASIEFHSAAFRAHSERSLRHLVDDRLLAILQDFSARGEPVDLQDVLLRLTFDNVSMLAFGVDPGCLRRGLPDIPFARAFEQATEATVYRFVSPTVIWKAMRFLGVGMERTLKHSLKAVDDFANSVIETRLGELATGGSKAASDDLLTIFMKLKDENGHPYSRQFLRDTCINFILAGRDTSSVALSWFFWLLERHPKVENNILAEIRRVLGKRKTTGTDAGFTVDEVKQMPYLHAAISEALRLYPSVPVDHKEVAEDDRLPDGTFLKKGSKVLYMIYAMGRMESVWGKDCLEYKPERWLRDGTFMSESAYKFTAFNGGQRLCLGKDFAYLQMKWVAASVLRRYAVKVVHGHPVKPKLALTMYMKHGLRVTLHPRQSLLN